MPGSPHSCLPCMVPEGAKWLSSIANRAFKTKVIELVLWRLPHLLLAKYPGKTLIVDFQTVNKYTWDPTSSSVRDEEMDMTPMGEADVKFVRYADIFGKLLVDSIDGDSVPIALVHHERLLGQVCDRMFIRTDQSTHMLKHSCLLEHTSLHTC